VQKQEFSVAYVYVIRTLEEGSGIVKRDKPIRLLIRCCVDGYNFNNLIFCTQQDAIYKADNPVFSSESMLHKEYDRKGSVGKKLWL
jgi:hypothetical protein